MTLPAVDRSPATRYDPRFSTSGAHASAPATAVDRRRAWLAPLTAAIIALVAALHAMDGLPVGGFYDDSFYVILAKSLATGQGYRNLNLPGAPFATHYPPGYPAFLALLWKLSPGFPENIMLFKGANALLLAIAALFALRLGRERFGLGTAIALAATIAGTATAPALYTSSMVVSEPLFLALLLPLLIVAERATEASVPGRRTSWHRAFALGAAAGAATLVRTHGIALVTAIVAAYALRRRWRDALLATVAAGAMLVPWLLWVAAHDGATPVLMRGDYGSYGAWYLDGVRAGGWAHVTATIGRNLHDVVIAIAQRLRPPAMPRAELATAVCVLALTIAGAVRVARVARVTAMYLVVYVAIVIAWPFPPVRFLLGIWVLLMLLLACGVRELFGGPLPLDATRGVLIARRGLAVAGAVLLVAGAAAYNVAGYSRHWWAVSQNLGARFLVPKLVWADSARRVEPDAVIATEHDEGAFYLYTGMHAVPSTSFSARDYFVHQTPAQDSAIFATLTRRFGARYALLSSPRMRAAAERGGAVGYSLLHRADGAGPWVYTLPIPAARPPLPEITPPASR